MYLVQTHDLAAGIADQLDLADWDAQMLLNEVLHPGEDDIFEGLTFGEPLPKRRHGGNIRQPNLRGEGSQRRGPRNTSAQDGTSRRRLKRSA